MPKVKIVMDLPYFEPEIETPQNIKEELEIAINTNEKLTNGATLFFDSEIISIDLTQE